MVETAPKKRIGAVPVLGIIVLVYAVFSILFLRNPAITAVDVAGRLQNFSETLNSDAGKVGRQASLTYGAITVEGAGYEKYVVIQHLHFALSARVGAPDGSWSLDTDKVSVHYDPLNDKRMIFKFADPILLTQNGQKKTLITMPTPIKFGYFGNDKPDIISLITIRLPAEITMTPQATGAQAAPPALVMGYDGLPELNVKHEGTSKTWEEKAEFRNIIIQSGNEQTATIGAMASDIEEKSSSDKLQGVFGFTVSDYTRRGNGKAPATCSLTSSIAYSTTETLMSFFGIADKAKVTASLNKFVIACDDFTVKLDGDVFLQPDDVLPGGAVTLTIDNAKAMLASDLIPDQARKELASALPRITGQPLEALTNNVTIPVKRDPNGALMLGAVTAKDAGITIINEWFPAK